MQLLALPADLLGAKSDDLQDSCLLELGFGLALTSLVLASDMHTLAANFLEHNCQNIPVSRITLIQCHWLSFAQAASSLAGRER